MPSLDEGKRLLKEELQRLRMKLAMFEQEVELLNGKLAKSELEVELLKTELVVVQTELTELKGVRSARNKRGAIRKVAIAQQAEWGTLGAVVDGVNKSRDKMQELKAGKIEASEEEPLQFLGKQKELKDLLLEALKQLDKLSDQTWVDVTTTLMQL